MTLHPSSIGSVGEPVFDAHNNRVRGFYSSVVDNPYQIDSAMEKARRLMDKTGSSRISLRFVVETGSYPMRKYESNATGLWLPASREYEPAAESLHVKSLPLGNWRNRAGIETIPIPIRGWDGCGIVYLGENRTDRIEPDDVRQREIELVKESIKTASARDPFHRAHSNGYRVELHHGITNDKDVRKLHELYTSVYRDYVFPLTEDNVAELVQNPESITAFIRGRDNDIAAAAVAEIARIPINGKNLLVCEISDEATHPNYRGNGLNQACVQSLVDELLKNKEELNLIYAEDRAVSRGVNQQSANLGWRFAGTLNRVGRIDADSDIKVEGPYEDLNVWFYPT